MPPLPYKTFQTTRPSPDYCPDYWARCRALREGQPRLRWPQKVLESLLPKHPQEQPGTYAIRCDNVVYTNHAGNLVGGLVAGLFAQQPTLDLDPAPDGWYHEWVEDVSRPGGTKLALNDLLKQLEDDALTYGVGWCLVDLPATDPNGPQPQSVADQEAMGALDVYAARIDPEAVRDWEEDEEGNLAWALLAFRSQKRGDLAGSRDVIEERFTLYTPTTFARYRIAYPKGQPPKPDELVPVEAEGPHSFGQVPMLRLRHPDGQHAMGKLEGPAAAAFRLENSSDWAVDNSLFPVLTAYLAPEQNNNTITSDPDRAVSQTRGPAYMVTLGQGDKCEYVGPPTAPFEFAQKRYEALVGSMHTLTSQMALAVPNSAAAMARSGTSKQADLNAESVVLKYHGEELNRFSQTLLGVVQKGRGDVDPDGEPLYSVTMQGMDDFNRVDMTGLLHEAQAVATVDINSPTFQVAYKVKLARDVLGDECDAEMLAQIRKELEAAHPAEMFLPTPEVEDDALETTDETVPEDAPPVEEPSTPPVPPTHTPVVAHIRRKPGKG